MVLRGSSSKASLEGKREEALMGRKYLGESSVAWIVWFDTGRVDN